MGCNCKKIEQVGRKNPNLLKHSYTKKGLSKLYEILRDNAVKYFGIIISILLFIGFLPFLVCNVIYTNFVKGDAYVTLPFLRNKKLKKESNG
jgi:hypothetical protein